jgi:hypothetical protein
VHTHKTSFLSPLSSEQILDRFRQFANQRGWHVTVDDRDRMHVQSGATLRAAGEDKDLRVEREPQGARAHLVVKSKFGALQVVDWGEAATFYREILARWQAPETADN